MPRPVFRDFTGHWILPSALGTLNDDEWAGYRLAALDHALREAKRLEREERERYAGDSRIPGYYVTETEKLLVAAEIPLPSFDEIIQRAKPYLSNPLVDPTAFVSPRLWTPFNQENEKRLLQSSAVDIITEIRKQGRELNSLHWRELEELVAELLRSSGMEVHVVNESPQGGRDVIGRLPTTAAGMPVTIAIEVKHRKIVDRPLVQVAIQQNRQFPMLMFVTSGRFTIGAVKEAEKPENRMRLSLHDGIAVRDMIHSYPLS